MIYALYKTQNDQIKDYEIREAWDTYGWLGKCIQSFGEENEMKEDHLEGVSVSGRTIVK